MKKINVLLLDDKEENIISLQALLQEIEDIHIITSTDPNAALKICWKEEISIALVDVQMPGINGFEFVSLLKSSPKTRHIMTIMVTAISKEERYLLEGLKSGAVDYLYKPLNPDITRAKVESFMLRVRLEEELKEANLELERSKQELILAKEEADNARKTKEIFLANMSHEIRTPINGITGIINMLKSSTLSDEQNEWLEMLHDASKLLLVIINDILDLSRIDSGKLVIEKESFSLKDFLDNINRLYQNRMESKELTFKIEESTDIPEFVSFDAQRLQQVINNFLNNSLKFTEKGGIILSVKTIDSEPGRSKLRFEVQDTGIGISETHLSKIFQEFEQGDGAITKRYGGSGLGLAIVKRLADLMGGQVGTISEYGVGSTFYFEAWFEETPFSEAKKINELYVNFPKLPGTRVLIAEDNDLNAFMLSHILKSWDCKVDTVTNGALVLENLQNRKYDIILMDTHMPVMSGFEAIEKIRASQDESIRNTPVISISASVLQHEQAAALQAGAEEVIGKPFEPLDLYQKITKILKVDLPTTSEEHNS